jgi:hypothetical protein
MRRNRTPSYPRTIRPPEFRPGHVFWLPRGATWLNRNKPRPFVSTTRCAPRTTGIFAYGSTQNTETQFGARSVLVHPLQNGVNRNGLTASTQFYPGILVRRAYADLPDQSGSLGTGLHGLRLCLRNALGIGRGSCLRPDAPAGSRRGRIVELTPGAAAYLQTRFAALLTNPEYSCEKRYHVILPLRLGTGFVAGEHVLRITTRRWFSIFSTPTQSILLPVPVVQSVWYEAQIVRETPYVLDEDILAQIDEALCAYFSLPPAASSTHG